MKEPFKLVQHEIDKIHLSIQEWSNKPFGYAQIIRDIESLLSSREAVEGGEVEAIRKELDFKETMYNASITVIKALRDDASKIKSELTSLRAALSEKEERIAELEQVKVVVPSDLSNGAWSVNFKDGWNDCLSELRRLNPALTFTELNHNEK